jgi:lipopolysaccharide/colanic/teichoic acid biosynthesis glycosyltransferase
MPGSLESGRTMPGSVIGARSTPPVLHEPVFKRPFDVVASGAALMLTAPLWAVIAAAILVEGGGPVLFRQQRIGRAGARFRLLKFRSMVVDPHNVDRQARPNDPRVTRVGRFVRRTGLDELPQLWNIFVGDMSFVGPRPQPERERVLVRGVETDLIVRQVPGHDLRTLVRPGLTGVAQVFAPRVVGHRQKFRYDAVYVRRVLAAARQRAGAAAGESMLVDLKMLTFDLALIIRSAWIGLRGQREV